MADPAHSQTERIIAEMEKRIAKEYLQAEEAFKAQGHSDYQQRAAQQIRDKYDFTKEDWQTFLEDAARMIIKKQK